jgi:hypothetical protein
MAEIILEIRQDRSTEIEKIIISRGDKTLEIRVTNAFLYAEDLLALGALKDSAFTLKVETNVNS